MTESQFRTARRIYSVITQQTFGDWYGLDTDLAVEDSPLTVHLIEGDSQEPIIQDIIKMFNIQEDGTLA